MGSTYWSDDDYRRRAARLRKMGRGAFEYHDDLERLPWHQRAVHEKMNPRGVKCRECRDSTAHPESRAVAVLFDVTGSMGRVPRILQENLCQLMNLLIDCRYLAHPQIMIGGIGDATCDRAPLQIGQFESGIEIDEDLAKLWLEGGGGGQKTESYELAMYFMARHTAIDCLEKRGRRGYLFIIGDEMPYRHIDRDQVAVVLGEPLEESIPVEAMVAELQKKYDTYFILPNLTSYYNDPEILHCWTRLLGEKVIRLEDPSGISDLIAAVIGMAEGVADIERIAGDLRESGRGGMARVVSQAVAGMGGVWREPVVQFGQRVYPGAAVAHGPVAYAGHKPRWHFDFSYNSPRWKFVMQIVRALARPMR